MRDGDVATTSTMPPTGVKVLPMRCQGAAAAAPPHLPPRTHPQPAFRHQNKAVRRSHAQGTRNGDGASSGKTCNTTSSSAARCCYVTQRAQRLAALNDSFLAPPPPTTCPYPCHAPTTQTAPYMYKRACGHVHMRACVRVTLLDTGNVWACGWWPPLPCPSYCRSCQPHTPAGRLRRPQPPARVPPPARLRALSTALMAAGGWGGREERGEVRGR